MRPTGSQRGIFEAMQLNGMMARVFIAALAAAYLTFSAHATEAELPGIRAEFEKLGSRLALTPTQTEQVRPIFTQHFEAQLTALKKFDGANVGQMRALAETLRENAARTERRLAQVLSGAQMAEYKRVRAEQFARLQEWMLSKYVDKLGARLELTPEQTERVRPVLKDHVEAQRAILDKYGIEPGNRGGKRPGFRTLRRMGREFDANRARTRKRLSAILPDAQLAAYDALQAEQRKRMRSLLLQR